MVIGIITADLSIGGCTSLKEKRMVLKSLKKRLRNKFNVAVSETDNHDLWQRGTLAVVTVVTDKRMANSVLSSIVNFLEAQHQTEIIDYSLELI